MLDRMDVTGDDVSFAAMRRTGNDGFLTQFHSPRHAPVLTHQQTWPQYSARSTMEASLWRSGSGIESTHRQPQTGLNHPASRPEGSNLQTVPAANPLSAWNPGSGRPEDSRHLSGHGTHPRPQSAETMTPQPFRNVVDGFCCPVCRYTFCADTQLSDHVRAVHKKSMCVACNKVFNSFASLCYHRNVKHGHSNHLKCGVCGKFFGHKQHMRTHMINVHNDYTSV